jgi:hypothetical protein
MPLRPGHGDSPADCVSRAARRLLLGLSMRQYSEAGHWPQPAGRHRNEPEPAHAPARAGSRPARPTSSLDNPEGPQRAHATDSRPSRAAARPRKHDDEGYTSRQAGGLAANSLRPRLLPATAWLESNRPTASSCEPIFQAAAAAADEHHQQEQCSNSAKPLQLKNGPTIWGAGAKHKRTPSTRDGAPFLHDATHVRPFATIHPTAAAAATTTTTTTTSNSMSAMSWPLEAAKSDQRQIQGEPIRPNNPRAQPPARNHPAQRRADTSRRARTPAARQQQRPTRPTTARIDAGRPRDDLKRRKRRPVWILQGVRVRY